MAASSVSEDAAYASQLTATRAAQLQRDTAETSDTAAVYKPSETSALLWVLSALALALLLYLTIKSLRNR